MAKPTGNREKRQKSPLLHPCKIPYFLLFLFGFCSVDLENTAKMGNKNIKNNREKLKIGKQKRGKVKCGKLGREVSA